MTRRRRCEGACGRDLTDHIAVSGSGYAYGVAVAACNGYLELGEAAEHGCFTKAATVDQPGRCRRPGCRQGWPS